MALRTVALCDGKEIGIDYIYSIIDGKKINDPEHLKEMRARSRNNELSCPCCGAILELVAGPKKEQHYRLKYSSNENDCQYGFEEKGAIESKMVLKGWMQKSLHASCIESRVPISAVSESNRKYEFTFLDASKSLAIEYDFRGSDITEEKIDILEKNRTNLSIVYIMDISNGGTEYQYPEYQMRVQERQGYCLLLDISNCNSPKMQVVYYSQKVSKVWCEYLVKVGSLYDYTVDGEGNLLCAGERIDVILEKVKEGILNNYEEEKRRLEGLKRDINETSRAESYSYETQTIGESSRSTSRSMRSPSSRIIRCKYCGKVDYESEFVSWIGFEEPLEGKCRDCSENNPDARVVMPVRKEEKPARGNANNCPWCGGQLAEKYGKNGWFIGCKNYPKCRYTRAMAKHI